MKSPNRKPLDKREHGIGKRLKELRELLRFSQSEFAQQVGINRQRLASYEESRAPIRYDLALKICRQFVIGEKWLATGNGIMRQCLDLNSRGVSHSVPVDTPFGKAYDNYLGDIYEKLNVESNEGTVVIINDNENGNFLRNYFNYLLNLWLEEIPKKRKVPINFVPELCATLTGIGLDFVHLSVDKPVCPTPEDLLITRAVSWKEFVNQQAVPGKRKK